MVRHVVPQSNSFFSCDFGMDEYTSPSNTSKSKPLLSCRRYFSNQVAVEIDHVEVQGARRGLAFSLLHISSHLTPKGCLLHCYMLCAGAVFKCLSITYRLPTTSMSLHISSMSQTCRADAWFAQQVQAVVSRAPSRPLDFH